jgi:hypothetical protein
MIRATGKSVDVYSAPILTVPSGLRIGLFEYILHKRHVITTIINIIPYDEVIVT